MSLALTTTYENCYFRSSTKDRTYPLYSKLKYYRNSNVFFYCLQTYTKIL